MVCKKRDDGKNLCLKKLKFTDDYFTDFLLPSPVLPGRSSNYFYFLCRKKGIRFEEPKTSLVDIPSF